PWMPLPALLVSECLQTVTLGFAFPPAEQAEQAEQSGHAEREGPLHRLLHALARRPVLFVLALDFGFVVFRAELRLAHARVGEAGHADELRARREKVRVPRHPVERVLEREDRARQVLRVKLADLLELGIAPDATEHLEL